MVRRRARSTSVVSITNALLFGSISLKRCVYLEVHKIGITYGFGAQQMRVYVHIYWIQ